LPFSVAIFVRRINEIGDMMRKLFVSATVMAALCSLTISVAPALGLEFEGETGSSKTKSTTAQIIRLGTSGWVECLKMTMKASPKVGASTKLPVTLEEPTTCSYNHNLIDESVTFSSCTIALESADLVELTEEEFGEGRAKFCTLYVEPVGGTICEIEITAPTTALPEYAWTNLDGTPGHYESLIHFKIENLKYTITGTGCKTNGSGSNGKYEGSIPIKYATIFPEF
jgi:hypothetical protein